MRLHPIRQNDPLLNQSLRLWKHGTALSIMLAHIDFLAKSVILDIGCGAVCCNTLGLEIDLAMIKRSINGSIVNGDAQVMPFKSNSVHAMTCMNVYEHTENPEQMMAEIHRVLKPGGVCYFVGVNRVFPWDQHHWVPWIAPFVVKSLKYVRCYGYWGLKRLVSQFRVYDYTRRIVCDPWRFGASYMLPWWKRLPALVLLKFTYWAFPTYVWVLEK